MRLNYIYFYLSITLMAFTVNSATIKGQRKDTLNPCSVSGDNLGAKKDPRISVRRLESKLRGLKYTTAALKNNVTNLWAQKSNPTLLKQDISTNVSTACHSATTFSYMLQHHYHHLDKVLTYLDMLDDADFISPITKESLTVIKGMVKSGMCDMTILERAFGEQRIGDFSPSTLERVMWEKFNLEDQIIMAHRVISNISDVANYLSSIYETLLSDSSCSALNQATI